MSKSTFFTGQPVFSQLLKFIPVNEVNSLSKQLSADRYYKTFKSFDHLVTMLFCSFHSCKSLREVTTGMQVAFNKLEHLGMKNIPRRSTLSDANKSRSEKFFGKVYELLYRRFYPYSPDSLKHKRMDERLFIIDSTTIHLFSDVMKGMGMKPVSGKSKGGAKAHVLMRADESVPRFVDLTHGTQNDKVFLNKITLDAGSIVVFDKGYNDYRKLSQWHKQGVTWVSRLKVNASYVTESSLEVSSYALKNGVIRDEIITMGRPSNKKTVKVEARKITYYHSQTKKTFEFITNNMKLSALTVAKIYKQRWQIEILFKRIKQSYPLRYFLGDNENAIKIQIWCALITDLLVKIVKDKLVKKWSYANIASMIRLHLMSYVDLFRFLNNPDKAILTRQPKIDPQLSLYT